MAQEVTIPGTQSTAKIRSIFAPALLPIITLGIYFFFWWYYINRELLQHVGIGHMCTGVIFDGTSDVQPTTCGIYRPLSEPAFSDETRAAMTALLPHLSRALGVMYRLRDAEFNLAVTLGALIIVPLLVSIWNTTKRVQAAQRLAGLEPLNGWIALILFVVISPAYDAYLQSGLNQVWERETAPAQAAPQPVA